MGEATIFPGPRQGKKLLERAWDALLTAGVDQPNATRLVQWMRQYILFHDRRHPQEMGMAEIQQFLQGKTFQNAAGGENRAEAQRALKFLYEQVLPPALRRKYPNADRELGWQYLFPSARLSVDPREKGNLDGDVLVQFDRCQGNGLGPRVSLQQRDFQQPRRKIAQRRRHRLRTSVPKDAQLPTGEKKKEPFFS